ncbi:Glycosyl hydrolase family 26 [Abditibacterium utsteinense]|uniref:Glycosyl hydrolase family 26 n=1 Tax=Abditibacterium utsteinense TaxID=1960156 RepID=A0A2S8SSV6_9BACT|nr:glycosyl hydrolase [Abditibacterium utsteinense]PQV63890.1 Glycosyl hydrolase family 26 [Abditibacterium utsteinense]
MPSRRDFLLFGAAALVPARLARAANLGAAAVSAPSNAVHASPIFPTLAKFEPPSGCYIGAFIERDSAVMGNIPAFEELTKRKHASYFTYVGYGRPFPLEWVRKVARNGGAPHLAFEPNDGLAEVKDGPYLRSWARDAARVKCPIFLRWASEMNGPWTKYGGDPALYKNRFQLVSRVMKEEAPNVAMLWTPFAEPAKYIPDYYPGDSWVDWVGVNIYSVYIHNGDVKRPSADEDPVAFLKTVYDLYAARKPIHISEFAATIYCKGTGQDTVEWAIEKTKRFYTALREQFPRVKSVNWFCLDTVQAGLASNNYSLLSDGRMLATYRTLVSDKYFLSRVAFNAKEWNRPIKMGTTLGQGGFSLPNRSNDDILAISGAVASTISEPFLRGLKNGDVVSGDLELWAQLPIGQKARGIIWQVDGKTIALTNREPFRVSVPRERLIEGEHTAKIIVLTRDGRQSESSEVRFSLE